MTIKHFKASEHSPESGSAFKLEDHLTVTTIDRIHAQSATEGHRLLPAVYTLEQGEPITAKALGPIAHYIIEGELVLEDVDDPDKKTYHLTAGDVLLRDEGTAKFSTPSKVRGFTVSYIPAPFVLPDTVIKGAEKPESS